MPSLLGLILVAAIIYLAVTQFAKIDRAAPSAVDEQIRMIDEQQPPPTNAQPLPTPLAQSSPTPSPTGGLRAPIDRTRQVLDRIQRRADEADQP